MYNLITYIHFLASLHDAYISKLNIVIICRGKAVTRKRLRSIPTWKKFITSLFFFEIKRLLQLLMNLTRYGRCRGAEGGIT